jgi:hypothetical protein
VCQVDSREQGMVVRAEYQRTPIPGMLVEPVHPGVLNRTGRVADEKVIQHQPGQRVEGVTPRGEGGRDAKAEPGVAQDPPGALVAPTAQIEVGAKDDGIVAKRAQEMLSLKGATRGSEPSVPRRPARVEVGAHDAEAAAADPDHCGYGDAPLEHEG